MLEYIYYPTGGYSHFIFEAHDYFNTSYSTSGGVRIKQIVNNDGISGSVRTKSYEYNVPGTTTPSGRLITYNLGYGYNTYYQEGSGGQICLLSTYRAYVLLPQSFVELGSSGGSPVVYRYVTVKETADGLNNGKSVFEYSYDPDDIYYGNDPYYIYCYNHEMNNLYYSESNEWKRGKLLEEIHYDNLGHYKRRIVNNYAIIDNYLSKEVIGLKVGNRTNYISCHDIDYYYYYYENKFNYLFTNISNKWIYLANSTIYTYDQDDDSKRVIFFTDYDYANEKHAQITKETTTGSGGNTVEKRYYYPQDYNSVENFSTLINNHIIAKPADIRTYNNTQLISGTQTKYNDYGQPIDTYVAEISPGVTDIAFSASIPYTFTHKANYEYNAVHNLVEVAPDDNVRTYYVWAYNSQYPVAKIESNINTSISVTVVDNNLSKSDVLSSIKNDVTYLKGLLSSYIIDPSYRVTLFTYKPLLGMTSQTDPTGVTTYYEYDAFGRLEAVKNHDENLLNKYEYHYGN